MKLSRARDLKFELPDGRSFIVPAPTIRQVSECVALDPAPDTLEAPAEKLARIARQVGILTGGAVDVDSLSFEEAMQVQQAIFAHVHGFDPVSALALQNWLRDEAKKKSTGAGTVTGETSSQTSTP